MRNRIKKVRFPGLILALVGLLSWIAFQMPTNKSQVARASVAADSVDDARAALEAAIEHEKSLAEAETPDEGEIKAAAGAVDAAYQALNDAMGAQNGVPLLNGVHAFTPEVEPNNDPDQAQLLMFDNDPCTIIDGSIEPNCEVNTFDDCDEDEDWYKFTASEDSRTWIYVDTGGPATGDTRDSKVTLYKVLSNGILFPIAFDDDDGTGNGLDTSIESGRSSVIAGQSLPDSKDDCYFIQVQAFDDDESINPYRLFVVVTDFSATAENNTANNSSSTPDTILDCVNGPEPVGLRSGSVSSDSDNDFYAIKNVMAGDILFIALDGEIGRDYIIDLFEPGNTSTPIMTVDSSDFLGLLIPPPAEGFAFLTTLSGDYLVKVRRKTITFVDFGNGNYKLMVAKCSQGVADLDITKSAEPSIAVVGQNLVFTIVVKNVGTAPATNVVITDMLPPQVSFVSCSAPMADSCTHSMGTVTATFSSIPDGEMCTITITALVITAAGGDGDIVNSARVVSDTTEDETSAPVEIPSFDCCLQDDSNSSKVLVFNSLNGEYIFCCGSSSRTGTGKISRRGMVISIADSRARLRGDVDKLVRRGNASINASGFSCTIQDRELNDNDCVCQVPE